MTLTEMLQFKAEEDAYVLPRLEAYKKSLLPGKESVAPIKLAYSGE